MIDSLPLSLAVRSEVVGQFSTSSSMKLATILVPHRLLNHLAYYLNHLATKILQDFTYTFSEVVSVAMTILSSNLHPSQGLVCCYIIELYKATSRFAELLRAFKQTLKGQ